MMEGVDGGGGEVVGVEISDAASDPDLQAEDEVICAEQRLAAVTEELITNDLILREILERVHYSDLRNARLVCRLWYNMSRKTWAERACVNLNNRICGGSSNSRYAGFLESVTAAASALNSSESFERGGERDEENNFIPQTQPFQTYRLTGWNIIYPPENDLFGQLNFWKACRLHVKHLHLDKCTLCPRRFVRLLNVFAPKVESLKFSDSRISVKQHQIISVQHIVVEREQVEAAIKDIKTNANLRRLEVSGSLPVTNYEFLCKFPNLKEIRLKKLAMEGLIYYLANIRSNLQQQHPILNLTKLDILDTCTYQSIQRYLIAANLPLKYLAFRVDRSMNSPELQVILHHFAPSLETLKLLRIPEVDLQLFDHFPCQVSLERLSELELWGNMVTNLNFLVVTPKLRRLRLDVRCAEKLDILRYEHNPHQVLYPMQVDIVGNSKLLLDSEDQFTVKSLKEFRTDYELGERQWEKLAEWMPRLERIVAPALLDECRQVLHERLPYLSEIQAELNEEDY